MSSIDIRVGKIIIITTLNFEKSSKRENIIIPLSYILASMK